MENHTGATFMNLPTAFHTMNHDLLVAKLEAYEFSSNVLLYI